jgi:O-antigen/teichoic acid export membrane protein
VSVDRIGPSPPEATSVDGQADPQEHLGKHAAAGFLWLAAQKWAVRVSGLATLVVLTHEISPRDFGVVAAAMTVVPIVYLLADLGFSTYLLQTDDLDELTLSTAFWTSVAAAAVLSAGLWGVAPLLAMAFRIDELEQVLRVLVLAVVPTVLAGVPLAMLRRTMAFRTLALQTLVAALIGQVVAVVLALQGGGVWALVSQLIVVQWVVAILAWWRVGRLQSWRLSPPRLRQMAVFGVRVSTVDFVGTMTIWAQSWIVTVALGPSALGLLNIGQRLVFVAQELVAASMVPVSTVVFARVRDTPDRLRTTYLKALGVVYAVVSPVMILLVVTAPVLIPLLFGHEWKDSVAPAQALALAGIITLGAMLDHGLFYGLGRPGTWLSYAVFVDGATIGSAAITVRWGLTGVAVGFVVVALLATVARWILVSRVRGWRSREVAGPFFRVAPITVVSMVIGAIALDALPGRPLAGMLVAGVVTLAVYGLLLRLLARGIIRDALGILPVPDKYVARVARLLGVEPDRPA